MHENASSMDETYSAAEREGRAVGRREQVARVAVALELAVVAARVALTVVDVVRTGADVGGHDADVVVGGRGHSEGFQDLDELREARLELDLLGCHRR